MLRFRIQHISRVPIALLRGIQAHWENKRAWMKSKSRGQLGAQLARSSSSSQGVANVVDDIKFKGIRALPRAACTIVTDSSQGTNALL